MFKTKITFNKSLNYLLFLTIIDFNIFFYLVDRLKNYQTTFLLINIYLIFIYFLLNLRYDFDFNKWKNNIKKLIDTNYVNSNEIKNLLNTEMDYKDNKDNFRLFKNIFIKKNLLTKDYDDLKKTFLKFIPEDFINEIGNKWIDKINIWTSVKKYFTVIFLDIIWFTTFTEKIPQENALKLLNIYFDWIVDIVKSYWWYIDKFLWDWILIIFDSKDSDNAIIATIEMQKFISKLPVSGMWNKVSVWIWINSGEVILWTIGSKNRMEITIIWDVVNTASRIEWLSRKTKENIIISEETYNNIVNKDQFFINELWYKSLRWKKISIKIYGVESRLKK